MRYLLLFMFGITLHANEVTDQNTRVSFPSEISFDGHKLSATGVATREKFSFKVYSIASYLQNDTPLEGNIFEALISAKEAKQLTIHWLMKVRGEKVIKGFKKSLKKLLGKEEFKAQESEITSFLSVFDPGVEKGDLHIFRSLNGETVQAVEDNKVVSSITSAPFQKAFWSIWFGKKPAVNKDNLINLL